MQFYDRDLNMSIHKDQPKKNVPFNSVHDLGFYYTRLSPFGIVRVELPLWIMKQKGFIDQLHEIICAQAAIGEGYPHLITEAHNGAVIRNNVAQFFVNNMVNEATKHGLSVRGSTKEIRKMIN
jgi:hypothetical protein